MNISKEPEPESDPTATPEVGSVDWLWFRPISEKGTWGSTLYLGNHRMCLNCDVYVSRATTPGRLKCWYCGKFVSRRASAPPSAFG